MAMDLLGHIEAFVAVADERGFTRAAVALGLPQPALSRRVRALEHAWGGALFDRGPRQVELTPLGELALPYGRDLLKRARHLSEVVTSAGSSAIRLVGVPDGCPPAALAHVLRAGGEHGVAFAVHEAGAEERAESLRDGGLSVAVLRAPIDTAPLVVRLGLACAQPFTGRVVHLDALRPRRGEAAGATPAVLFTAEDDLEPFGTLLRRAFARSGLPDSRLRISSSPAAAAAEVLAGEARLLCAESFARDHALSWTPLADRTLDRGYELATAPGAGRAQLEWLAPLLASAIGATERDAPETVVDPGELASRLIAHG